MPTKRTTLFSVEQVRDGGEVHYEVKWSDDASAALDDISPNAEWTDRIIDLAEELDDEIQAWLALS